MQLLKTWQRIVGMISANPAYLKNTARRKLRKALALDYRLFRGGRSFNPHLVALRLTERCNLRCKMCSLWASGATQRDTFLPLETAKRLIDEVVPFRPFISMGGGEPLFYPHLIELLGYIKQKRLCCTVTTNGTLLRQHAREIVSLGVDTIAVSIDGRGEIHDRLRGVPQTFERAMEGIDALSVEKRRLARATPRVSINCAITGETYLHLEEMVEVGNLHEIDKIFFTHLFFRDKAAVESHNRLFGQLCPVTVHEGTLAGIDPARLSEILRKVMAQQGRARAALREFPELSPLQRHVYYQESLQPVGRLRCTLPWNTFVVAPDGSVQACIGLDCSVGNIKEGSFSAIWNNECFRSFRRKLRGEGPFPICYRCCGVYISSQQFRPT